MKMNLIVVMTIAGTLGAVSSVHASGSATGVENPQRALTLSDAVSRTLARNPALKSAMVNIRIAEADVRQARLIPNPEVDWEGEDISGSRGGLSNSAHTIVLSQVIELGGKRSSRIGRAESNVTVAEADCEAVRLDVLAELTSRFTRARVAQERLELLIASLRLAEDLQGAAQEKVTMGAAATVEAIRADVAVSNARVDSARALSEWTNAKRQVAAMWGDARPDFDSLTGDLPACVPPPEISALLALEDETPQVRRWSSMTQRAKQDLTAVRAAAVPDLTVSAGPRFFAENGERTFVLGLSLPIPLFNRNQGAVVGARRAIEQTEWEHQAARVQWRSRLLSAHEQMSAAYNEAATIEKEVIPRAETAFEAIQHGYEQGRFDYLDLFAAEQDLIAARERLLDARRDYLTQRIEIESLIGRNIEEREDSDVQ